MRLTDLDPHWIQPGKFNDPSLKAGLSFRCPHCELRLGVWFKNPIDPNNLAAQWWDGVYPWVSYPQNPPIPIFWEREGESFENITVRPSVDASGHGHWHGFITNGEVI